MDQFHNTAADTANIQTPFFVLDEKLLLHDLSALKAAIQKFWNNTEIAYSVKTNSLPALACLLRNQNIFAEVVSEDEFKMIKLCGFSSSQIVCNGPVKSRKWVYRILQEKSFLNIDSHAELQYVSEYSQLHTREKIEVGLRIHSDIESFFPNESTSGKLGGRFGFCIQNGELERAISTLRKNKNVSIIGLHLHTSTRTRRIEIYQWLVQNFANIIKKYGLSQIRYLDIGGGFFGGLPDKPNWNDYLQAISESLYAHGFSPDTLKLILEPGVGLLAGAFSYVMGVSDVKRIQNNCFVVMDGSRIHIDPFFHKESYFLKFAPKLTDSEICPEQKLVGFTCLENDVITTITDKPRLNVGDRIIIKKIGAYTLSLSPLFISYFPAVWLLKQDGSLQCLRERWTAKQFIQNSIIQ